MGLAGKALQAPRGKVVVEKQGRGREQFVQALDDELLAALHARGTDLQGAVFAVAVDDQTGQEITLAVAEPVPGFRKEPLAQNQGTAQALMQQGLVQRRVGPVRMQARADQRGRVQADAAQRRAARVAERGFLAGRKVRERAFLRIHFIAEHPEMPGADAAVLILFEPEFTHASMWLRLRALPGVDARRLLFQAFRARLCLGTEQCAGVSGRQRV